MKVCPKCGRVLLTNPNTCPHCESDTSQTMVFDEVKRQDLVSKEELGMMKRRKFLLVVLALLMVTGVALVNFYGTLSFLSIVLGAVGIVTIFFPRIYIYVYYFLFVLAEHVEKPTVLYYIFHVLAGLTCLTFSFLLPYWTVLFA